MFENFLIFRYNNKLYRVEYFTSKSKDDEILNFAKGYEIPEHELLALPEVKIRKEIINKDSTTIKYYDLIEKYCRK